MHNVVGTVKSAKWDRTLKILAPLSFAVLWLILDTPKFPSPCTGGIDPWIYLGLNLHYEFLANIFSGQYYTTRLPVIIPGFFAYKLFDIYTAALFIRLFKLLMILIPLYWLLVRLTKDHLISTLALSILFFDPTFLVGIATDYVNGYGMAYVALATACLTAACLTPNWRFWLIMAGIAQALMIYTYLFLVSFFITQVIYLLILNQFTHRLSLTKILFYLGMGGGGCTIILGCFAFYHKGYFFFWYPQLKAAIGLSSQIKAFGGTGSPWKTPFSQWIPNAVWLILPVSAFLLSLEHLWNKRVQFSKAFSDRRNDINFICSYLLVSQFLVLFLMYSFLEIIGYNFLELDFTACFIFPLSITVMGIILSDFKTGIAKLKDYKYIIVGIYILTAALLLSSHPIYFGVYTLMIIIVLIGARSPRVKPIYWVAFLSIQILSYHFTNLNKVKDVNFAGAFGTIKQTAILEPKDDYFLMIKISQIIKGIIPNTEKPMVWYGFDPTKDCLSNFFLATAETFLGGYMTDGPNAAFSKYFPQLNNTMLEEAFKNNNTIILLSSDPDAMQKAEKALNQKGYGWNTLKQEKFNLEKKGFVMLAFLLTPLRAF